MTLFIIGASKCSLHFRVNLKRWCFVIPTLNNEFQHFFESSNGVKMGLANSLQVSAWLSEYNEDFILFVKYPSLTRKRLWHSFLTNLHSLKTTFHFILWLLSDSTTSCSKPQKWDNCHEAHHPRNVKRLQTCTRFFESRSWDHDSINLRHSEQFRNLIYSGNDLDLNTYLRK